MKFRIFIVFILLSWLIGISKIWADEFVFTWLWCDGTVVGRTEVGKLETRTTEKNLPGCLGPKWWESVVSEKSSNDESKILRTGAIFDNNRGITDPILDLAQKDIVAYRRELMRSQQIRYTNALRSVRMRAQATKNSHTNAYLIRNDAVIVTQSWSGWTGVQGANISVTDPISNIVAADTVWKAKWYIATKYLRNPNPSDLVRIEQADQQFWSDLARVNVDHSVNVRAHPWYGSKILFVLTDSTPLYVVSTIDNWSEVISDDRTLHGYIRSDYLTIEKKQRVEVAPLLR